MIDIPKLTDAEIRALPVERRVELLRELERRYDLFRELMPLCFFKPNPPQYRMIRAIGEHYDYEKKTQRHTQFGCFWANGCGKSWGAVALIGNIVWGPQNPWFDFPLFRRWPFKRHIRLVVTADELKVGGEMLTAIERWWPKHKYRAEKLGMDYLSSFEFLDDNGQDNGFRLTVRTFEQDAKLHESAGLGAAIFNEPPPKKIYDSYPARFRDGGFRLVAGTLLFESAWIMEEFTDNPRAWYEFASDEENCAEHGRMDTPHGVLTGYLSHESIEQRALDYADDERDTRRTGKPVHLRASVFDFDPQIHVIPDAEIPSDTTNFLVVDPHPNRPWAILVGGVTPAGDYIILDEWPDITVFNGKPYHKIEHDNRGLSEYAEIIHHLMEKHSVVECIIDGKFANSPLRVLNQSTTLRDQLMELGLFFADGNPNIEGDGGGIRRLQQLLAYDKTKPVDALNRPRFYIRQSLVNCKLGIQNLRRKRNRSLTGFIYRDALEEQFLDFPRCMMYFVMHRAAAPSHDAAGVDPHDVKWRRRLEARKDLVYLDE